MLIYFTSGTSGYPKMVMHNFLYPIGHIITAKYWQQPVFSNRTLVMFVQRKLHSHQELHR